MADADIPVECPQSGRQRFYPESSARVRHLNNWPKNVESGKPCGNSAIFQRTNIRPPEC